jgi:hypothetical protein
MAARIPDRTVHPRACGNASRHGSRPGPPTVHPRACGERSSCKRLSPHHIHHVKQRTRSSLFVQRRRSAGGRNFLCDLLVHRIIGAAAQCGQGCVAERVAADRERRALSHLRIDSGGPAWDRRVGLALRHRIYAILYGILEIWLSLRLREYATS